MCVYVCVSVCVCVYVCVCLFLPVGKSQTHFCVWLQSVVHSVVLSEVFSSQALFAKIFQSLE